MAQQCAGQEGILLCFFVFFVSASYLIECLGSWWQLHRNVGINKQAGNSDFIILGPNWVMWRCVLQMRGICIALYDAKGKRWPLPRLTRPAPASDGCVGTTVPFSWRQQPLSGSSNFWKTSPSDGCFQKRLILKLWWKWLTAGWRLK